MNDPWADMRERLEWYQRDGIKRMTEREFVRLLADADALLAVARAVVASKTEDDGFVFEELGWPLIDDAMAALPEYLREPSDGK